MRFVCESLAGLRESVGVTGVDEVLKRSYDKVFGKFVIFDEAYRETLCCKILKHYYTKEICEEVVGLWLLRVNTKINEIMPYYNQLYKSTQLEFDVFNNLDISKDVSVTGEGTNSSNQTQTANGSNAFSDTPQGGLVGLETDTYLTNASKNRQDGSAEGTGQYSNTGTQKEVIKGKDSSVSNSKLLLEYRTTMINIDMQVIEEFKDFFIQIW